MAPHPKIAALDKDNTIPLPTDLELRRRIYERHYHFNGHRYAEEVLSMLPRFEKSVFMHGDIAPRNIVMAEDGHVKGSLNWETAGWCPEYWEYVNMIKPSGDKDKQAWIERTAPKKWDITRIAAVRWSYSMENICAHLSTPPPYLHFLLFILFLIYISPIYISFYLCYPLSILIFIYTFPIHTSPYPHIPLSLPYILSSTITI
ncbi:hypothetical protein K469DRAFT_168678 [Zopfia rhizophila CBS 207.26]|uniref:non-specific serine/threonine protein kinase n=1 Tax=Zopfia rhizophila CBS 207.26 TaxID=1314779 RepID=A0A6A6E1Z0_9PEZI|nr:hypothetical protein K469DRAFT_168678 [Zopfia rhizophila CBS 207.26]